MVKVSRIIRKAKLFIRGPRCGGHDGVIVALGGTGGSHPAFIRTADRHRGTIQL